MKRIIEFKSAGKAVIIFYSLLVFSAFLINGYINFNQDKNKAIFMGILGLCFCVFSLFVFNVGAFKQNSFVFLLLFLASLISAIACTLYNGYIIPVLGILILFYILSDKTIAIYSFLLIVLLVAINSANSFYLLVFIPSGMLLIYCIEITECKSIVLPVISANFLSAFIYSFILLLNEELIKGEMIIYPAAGFVLNILIAVITLFSYRRYFLNKYEDISILINDPEYFLLTELKSKNSEEYKLAIHTAYLCDRISSLLNYDRVLAKCLGYYHRIGVLQEGKISENTLNIAKENSFPPALLAELKYYNGNGKKYPITNELTVLTFSTEVIRSILIFIKNYPERKVDYDAIIDKIFEIKLQSETLKHSQMKSTDLYKMKQYLKDEKLYYDFLR